MTAARDLTFGVELEVYVPQTVSIACGAYHHGVQISQLPRGWNGQRDGSLVQPPVGYYGIEIVSPVLKGAGGIKQVIAVVEWLRSIGAKVNQTTGFHVHVGFDRENREGLKKLVALTAQVEKGIYASTGTASRESGRYCRSIRHDYHEGNPHRQYATYDRFHVLNVSNLEGGTKPTVEFRAFAGTLNTSKILGHVYMCLGLVERALKSKTATKWTASIKTTARKGEGQSTLNKIFYQLGWTKGRRSEVYGVVECDGAPTLDAIKLKLKEMARKYDKRSEGPAE